MTKWRRFKLSLIRSWEDLHHIYACSSSSAFHFQDYRNLFFLPLTLSILHFTAFRIPVTFHPRRWPLARLAEYLRGGAPLVRTCPGRDWEVCCRTTTHQSPYSHFFLVE